MTHAPLRIGIVGVGFMGRQHVEFVRRSQRAELVAAADPFADMSDLDCAAYSSLDDMLDAGVAEAILLVNPNAQHVDTAIACLERGVAVLVEKPVATSYIESLRLIDAVERTGGRLLVGHHRRHHPAITRARAALAAGAVGDIVGVSGMWSARKEDAYFTDIEWHRLPGAGVSFINLVHDLDLLRHLCGEIVEVQAMLSTATEQGRALLDAMLTQQATRTPTPTPPRIARASSRAASRRSRASCRWRRSSTRANWMPAARWCSAPPWNWKRKAPAKP